MTDGFVGLAQEYRHYCQMPVSRWGFLWLNHLPIGTLWQCPECLTVHTYTNYDGSWVWWFTTPDDLPDHLKIYAGVKPFGWAGGEGRKMISSGRA